MRIVRRAHWVTRKKNKDVRQGKNRIQEQSMENSKEKSDLKRIQKRVEGA